MIVKEPYRPIACEATQAALTDKWQSTQDIAIIILHSDEQTRFALRVLESEGVAESRIDYNRRGAPQTWRKSKGLF